MLRFECLQVAASVEDQLAAARASIDALNAEREQRERDVDTLQDKFRQMLIIRCVGIGPKGHWLMGFTLTMLADCIPITESTPDLAFSSKQSPWPHSFPFPSL